MRRHRTGIIMLVLAVLLIASFVLHVVEFDHNHSGVIFGEGVQAIMHSSDKKKVFLDVVNFPLLGLGLLSLILGQMFISWSVISRIVISLRNPIQRAMSKGILQPKLCE